MKTAVITNIQSYSIHDGPGIRTTVFMKGCPLSCAWCANPETLCGKPDISYNSNLCVHCGRCAESCVQGAVDLERKYIIDRDKCARCFDCVGVCFYGALAQQGEEMTSAEVYDKVRRDKMFYDSSGGGVTFSGGEPLVKPQFVAEVAERLGFEGIRSCVETCGAVPWSAFETILPYVELIYFDLKLIDEKKHRKYTGAGNSLILENAQRINAGCVDVIFRRPLIPEINADLEETVATAEFLQKMGSPQLELLPYHRLGLSKYELLAMQCNLSELQPAEKGNVEAVCNVYRQHGIKCKIVS
ncbi:MAG: glycyl-radical enzyme activating protein [Oscillospiraceae bacterium]|nr:glycyl-radical enzyme activating protein [Oscillospiraceae bacterium]